MIFGRKKKAARTCSKGHPLEDTWERCPFCAAEDAERSDNGDGKSSVAERGKGAVKVSKRSAPRVLAGWLVAMNGDQAGEDFRVNLGRNLIGKGTEVDILIRDAHLSERHAVLEARQSGEYVLRDLDSKHGSFVNGQRVTEARTIADGDVVRVARAELKFRSFTPITLSPPTSD